MTHESLQERLKREAREEYGCKKPNCNLVGDLHGNLIDLDDLDEIIDHTIAEAYEAGRKEREGEIRETIVCVKCNGSGANSGPGYFVNCLPCSGTGILVDGVLNDILSLTPTPEERKDTIIERGYGVGGASFG